MIKVTDNMAKFIHLNSSALDRALNRMAIDIERLAKSVVPFKKGPLKASGRHLPLGYLKYQIEFNKIYAAFQEWGGDDTRKVKHYTTPGTGKFFLRNSGNTIKNQGMTYLKTEISLIYI